MVAAPCRRRAGAARRRERVWSVSRSRVVRRRTRSSGDRSAAWRQRRIGLAGNRRGDRPRIRRSAGVRRTGDRRRFAGCCRRRRRGADRRAGTQGGPARFRCCHPTPGERSVVAPADGGRCSRTRAGAPRRARGCRRARRDPAPRRTGTPPVGSDAHVMNVAFLRHGPTEWNALGRMQGRFDAPLSVAGRREIAAWTIPAAVAHGAQWISSPLSRAVETALQLSGTAPALAPALTEMDWGAWEGYTHDELRERCGDEFTRNAARGLDFRPPGGESPRDVVVRV